jgi:hypothetical protein
MHSFCPPRFLCACGLIGLLLAPLLGCGDTNNPSELRITDGLASEVSRGSLMLGALAAELALNISAPAPTSACPSTFQDQDELSLDYGAGCVSETGLFKVGLSGSVSLTLAGGSGVFVGELHSLGFPDLPILGSVSGQVSRAGDLITADIEFSGLVWTDDGLEDSFDGLFEVSIDGEDILLNVTSASLVRGAVPEFRVDLEDIVPAPTSLGACWIPSEGQIVLEREAASATLSYSEVAYATGEVPVAYGSRDPVTLEPCR